MNRSARNHKKLELAISIKNCPKYQALKMILNQKEKAYFKNNNYLPLNKKIIKTNH